MPILANSNIPYPDFQNLQIIDPDKFDANNAELQNKLNEVVDFANDLQDPNVLGIQTSMIVDKAITNDKLADDVKVGSLALLLTTAKTSVVDSINELFAYIASVLSALNTHKASNDHDGVYYTKTLLDSGQLDNRYYTETEVNNMLTNRDNNLNTHKSSNDHDSRYISIINTSAYTPTSNYHPSTKLYVDQTVAGAVLGGIPNNSITDIKMAPGYKKADIVAAAVVETLPLVPPADFDFDNPIDKNGWQYSVAEVGNVITETYTLSGLTKSTRVTTFDSPTVGQITQVTTTPLGKINTIVYNVDDTASITEV